MCDSRRPLEGADSADRPTTGPRYMTLRDRLIEHAPAPMVDQLIREVVAEAAQGAAFPENHWRDTAAWLAEEAAMREGAVSRLREAAEYALAFMADPEGLAHKREEWRASLHAAMSEGAAPRAEGLDVERLAEALRTDPGIDAIFEDVDAAAADIAYRYADTFRRRPSDERVPESEER